MGVLQTPLNGEWWYGFLTITAENGDETWYSGVKKRDDGEYKSPETFILT